jgi:alanine racemase
MGQRFEPARPTWVEIDLGAVEHNVAHLRSVVAPARLWAVVKADGYGHGAVAVARAARRAGAAGSCVALVEEGEALRAAGIDGPIVILSEPSPAAMARVAAATLEPTVYHPEGIEAAAAAGVGTVHLKVETGMHRVGCDPTAAVALADRVAERGLLLGSVWTHCAVADEPDDPFTGQQLDRYEAVLGALAGAGHRSGLRHAANSAAALSCPRARYDVVRCGIALYGLSPGPALATDMAPLRPALRWVSRVSHVQRLAAGESVSYGRRYRTARPTTIVTVPVGYADGVPRRWWVDGGAVLIGGRPRAIAGVVTMDQLMVDVGDDPVEVGEEVVLIGTQGDAALTAEMWADRLSTITYEVTCAIGARVPRR